MVLIQKGDLFAAHLPAREAGAVLFVAAVGDIVFALIFCDAGVAAAGDAVPSLQENVVVVVVQRHDIGPHRVPRPGIAHGIAVIQNVVDSPAE